MKGTIVKRLSLLLVAMLTLSGIGLAQAPAPPTMQQKKVVVVGNLTATTSPGQHKVTLSWNPSATLGVTYNVYRGASSGVCSGSPTPFATGVATTQFVDTTGLVDGQTLFYNVSAVKGGESACVSAGGVEADLQVQIPVLPGPASGLSATTQ